MAIFQQPSGQTPIDLMQARAQALTPQTGPAVTGLEGVARVVQALQRNRTLDKIEQERQREKQRKEQGLINAIGEFSKSKDFGAAFAHVAGMGADAEKLSALFGKLGLDERGKKTTERIISQQKALDLGFQAEDVVAEVLDAEGNVVGHNVKRKAPTQEKRDTIVKRALALGLEEGSPEFNDFVERATFAARTSIQIDEGDRPTKEQELASETFGKAFGNFQEASDQALESNAVYSRVTQLAKVVKTGRLAPATTFLKNVAKGFGIDLGDADDVGQAEALRSLGTRLQLDFVQRTKGAVSDREMDTFQRAVPGLSNTVEGNLLIAEFGMKMNDRAIERAKQARVWLRGKGSLGAINEQGEDFFDNWNRWTNENAVFSDDDLRRMVTPPEAETVIQPSPEAAAAPTETRVGLPAQGQSVTDTLSRISNAQSAADLIGIDVNTLSPQEQSALSEKLKAFGF